MVRSKTAASPTVKSRPSATWVLKYLCQGPIQPGSLRSRARPTNQALPWPAEATMKFAPRPTASSSVSTQRHQRSVVQHAPTPANSAMTGNLGIQKRSMRWLNNHQAAITNAMYAKSPHRILKRLPQPKNANTTNNFDQRTKPLAGQCDATEVLPSVLGKIVRTMHLIPLPLLTDIPRTSVEYFVQQRIGGISREGPVSNTARSRRPRRAKIHTI